MLLQGGLAIDRMCFLAGVSRAGFYRYLRAQDPLQEEMAVRSEVQRIALEHYGRYGYRRITAELRRQGILVNHKRVARLMRDDNLVGTELRHCRDELRETANHGEIYVNLGNRLKLTGPNQVWVADITFVRLKHEFVYLAVVLDKFSRRVVGPGNKTRKQIGSALIKNLVVYNVDRVLITSCMLVARGAARAIST